MGHGGDEESAGFWPGYVAAVACLVQSLLLLCAVMAMTVYQLGILAGRKIEAAAVAAVVPPPATDSAQRGGIALAFPGTTWRIDAAARERLRTELAKRLREGVTHWRISLRTQTDDTVRRRSGYLRLMVVRNELMLLGVVSGHIDVRLLDAPDDDGSGEQTVRIEPLSDDAQGRGP